MLKELIATVWDMILYGDLRGHLRALWDVISGRVGPETSAAEVV